MADGLRYYNAPFGRLLLQSQGNRLTRIDFMHDNVADDPELKTDVTEEAAQQLDEYFAGRLRRFTLPLANIAASGLAAYQEELRYLAYGEVISYGALAERVKTRHPSRLRSHARAAATACAKNPIPIIVPCHRVVGQKGAMCGYLGGIEAKEFLLALEKQKASL